MDTRTGSGKRSQQEREQGRLQPAYTQDTSAATTTASSKNAGLQAQLAQVARAAAATEAEVRPGARTALGVRPFETDFGPTTFEVGVRGMVTPTQPGSPVSSLSTSDDMDIIFHTPPPMPPFTHPPSPPRPELRRKPSPRFTGLGNEYLTTRLDFGQSDNKAAEKRQGDPWFRHLYSTQQFSQSVTVAAAVASNPLNKGEDEAPRKPLTSIVGSSRCLWPPDSTYLTMSSSFKERAFQHRRIEPENGVAMESASASALTSISGLGPRSTVTAPVLISQKNSSQSGLLKDTSSSMQDLQPCRKARRVMDGPYFKERNHRMVAGHVRKLIQEAVEDGVGELDLSCLELTDLPSEIRDLNYAIVFNERGSFSLSKNRLRLFLSSNQFSRIPMDVFALHNLSVLSIRNNHIDVIPPEIGLLNNLVELSVGGNLLKVLPSQIALLPKLEILTIHPNPFMAPPEPEPVVDPHEIIQGSPQVFGGHGSNIVNGVDLQESNPDQHNNINSAVGFGHVQNLAQTSLISPPASPPLEQTEDIDMAPPPDQEGSDGGLLQYVPIAMSAAAEGQVHYSGESSSHSQGSELAVTVEEGNARNLDSGPPIVSGAMKDLPPHKVTRSRIPSLLILAGNALLNYKDAQDATATKAVTEGAEPFLGRPRKDSKILMDGVIWPREQLSAGSVGQEQRAETVVAGVTAAAMSKRKRHMFKEETIKSYMTPYLFDIFKRARRNNRCAGCQRTFWKSCRIVVVWQEILGQTQVPIQWKGCGVGGCSGVPASLWEVPEPLLEPESMSVVTSPVASAATVNPLPGLLEAETNTQAISS